MRMWNVPTEIMCRKHLLGEHLETHMFLGTLKRGSRLTGYIDNGLFDIRTLKGRHDALAEEMKKRGYNHTTPMNMYDIGITPDKFGDIDTKANIIELARRCPDCLELQKGHKVYESSW